MINHDNLCLINQVKKNHLCQSFSTSADYILLCLGKGRKPTSLKSRNWKQGWNGQWKLYLMVGQTFFKLPAHLCTVTWLKYCQLWHKATNKAILVVLCQFLMSTFHDANSLSKQPIGISCKLVGNPSLLKTQWQHSEECMCRLWNIAMRDYQESLTTGQTDRWTDERRTKWSLCAAMLSQVTQKENMT